MNSHISDRGKPLAYFGLSVSALIFVTSGLLLVVREIIRIGQPNPETIDWSQSIAIFAYPWALPTIVFLLSISLCLFVLCYMWCVRHYWFRNA